jgi:hypothetical protein
MCVIMVKPVGVRVPPPWAFEQAYRKNPHGAGFALADPDRMRVVIRKGFRSGDAARRGLLEEIAALRRTPRGVLAVVHFRLATHGSHSDANCHPFPLSGDTGKLRAAAISCRTAVAHNGILPVAIPPGEDISDTMSFVRESLSKLRFSDIVRRRDEISRFLGQGRLAVLHHDQRCLRLGEFVRFRGCYWSNRTFFVPPALRRRKEDKNDQPGYSRAG